MPGPIDLTPGVYRPMSHIAYKDASGRWRAGPDAKGYDKGQYVPEEYAQKARKQRQFTNAVKQNMEKQDMSESEAREYVKEKNQAIKDELAKDNPDPNRIEELQRELGGSP